jgi:hypothetical protein
MSSKQYICELCKKVFKQKSDFQKHTQKRTPCITMNEIEKKLPIYIDIQYDIKLCVENFYFSLNCLVTFQFNTSCLLFF